MTNIAESDILVSAQFFYLGPLEKIETVLVPEKRLSFDALFGKHGRKVRPGR